jgi:LysR family transcriptional regulator of gallate degradation
VLPHDFNLRHLAAHAAIVATGSLSDAARRIHLTQPALTQGLAKLERQLAVDLFIRRPNGMEPTDAGRILALRAKAMVRLLGPRLPTNAQVRAFLALARAGNYRAAATATGLSEASLHRAVADLGVSLGAPIIERRGRSLALTRRGADAARRFALAIGEIESALIELTGLAGRNAGRIAIGAMPLSRSRLLPETVALFHLEHPEIALSIVEGSHAELVGPLRHGQISMMLGALRDEPGPDLANRALFSDRPFIVGRAGHSLCANDEPDGPALVAYPWIVSAEGTPLRALWRQMFEALGVTPPPVAIECGSVTTIRHLLAGSDFLTLLSADQVSIELGAGLLGLVAPAPAQLARTIGVTSRSDWRATPVETRLLEIMSEVASRIRSIGHS